MLNDERDRIDSRTREMITDYTHILRTSVACVHELLGLMHVDKVKIGKDWKPGISIVDRLKDFGVEVMPITEAHIRAEESLPWFDDHRDPFDRLIVAHAISERVKLVSSDGKFSRYVKYGLDLHENTW